MFAVFAKKAAELSSIPLPPWPIIIAWRAFKISQLIQAKFLRHKIWQKQRVSILVFYGSYAARYLLTAMPAATSLLWHFGNNLTIYGHSPAVNGAGSVKIK